jgi:hypothetical protein
MKWSTLALSVLPLVSAAPKEPKTPETFSQRVIFTPPDDYTDPRVLYARSAQFKNGDLLATWENYSPEAPPVYFPIYKSSDGGYNWKEISRVQDTENGFGTVSLLHTYGISQSLTFYRPPLPAIPLHPRQAVRRLPQGDGSDCRQLHPHGPVEHPD